MKRNILLFCAAAMLTAAAGCDSEQDNINIELTQKTIELAVGETAVLTYTSSPEISPEQARWTSSDESIATITPEGEITALSAGNCTVTISAGNTVDICEVTVIGKLIEQIVLDKQALSLTQGDKFKFSPMIYPTDAEEHITWLSENDEVCIVDENGEITAVSAGETNIVAASRNISVKCSVTVIAMAKIGDWIYSDGTYSTELDKNKKPIAIVYWLGDPTADDPALKAEHPQCKHGLAISLTGDKSSPWQENFYGYSEFVDTWRDQNAPEYQSINHGAAVDPDNLINKTNGYNNTKVLELFNNDPANSDWKIEVAEELSKLKAAIPTPENTSGWYIPSPKELALLCIGEFSEDITTTEGTDNINFISSKIQTVSWADTFGQIVYWTSAEMSPNDALQIGLDNGKIFYCQKNFSAPRFRAILAF